MTGIQHHIDSLDHTTAQRVFILLLIALVTVMAVLLFLLIPAQPSSSYSTYSPSAKKAPAPTSAHPTGYYDRGIDRTGGLQSEAHSIYQLGDFTLSLSGDTYKHLIIRVSVAFDGDPEEFSDAMKGLNSPIRHAVISSVSGIDGERLKTRSGKEALETLLAQAVASHVSHIGDVKEVLFSRFILQ
jgi:flagellar basal body-associated protein FliL